jgi:hypothetical protein
MDGDRAIDQAKQKYEIDTDPSGRGDWRARHSHNHAGRESNRNKDQHPGFKPHVLAEFFAEHVGDGTAFRE